MSPLLHDGDYLIVRKVFSNPKVRIGNVVTVRHPQFGSIVKAVIGVTDKSIFLKGVSSLSTPTDVLGAVESKYIDGVGVAVISTKTRVDNKKCQFKYLKPDATKFLLV